MQSFTRRHFIKTGIALAAAGALPSIAKASTLIEPASRSLNFHNIHTGESLKTTYWELGNYIPDALKDIAYILRDYRTDDMQPIDPHLLDVIAELHRRMDSNQPFEVISGYRTPRTNAMLHERTNGVAVNSLHMYGKAIDIRLSDRKLTALRDTAWGMQQGGVGYYAGSGFIHVDVGPVRSW